MRAKITNINYRVEMSAVDFKVLNDNIEYKTIEQTLGDLGADCIDYDYHFGEHLSFRCEYDTDIKPIIEKLTNLIRDNKNDD